jgi:hypothetical protein
MTSLLMTENCSFDAPIPHSMTMSFEAILKYLNSSSFKLFFVDAKTVDRCVSKIKINFDCDLSFDPTFQFSGFSILISNCSVLIHNLHSTNLVEIQNSSVAFHDCSFSDSQNCSITSDGLLDTIISDCEFIAIEPLPIEMKSYTAITVCHSTFSKCHLGIHTGANCNFKIMKLQFMETNTNPLWIGTTSAALIFNTAFSKRGGSVFLFSFSKASIQNWHFENMSEN